MKEILEPKSELKTEIKKPNPDAPSVLLVEDEPVLADTILFSIKKLGYGCRWARTLKEARQKIREEAPDFIVLDRNLPDGDGIDILAKKDRGQSMVLVLSSKASVEERVRGLRAGADDYLPKPFSYSELGARLAALERRWVAKPKGEPVLWSMQEEQMRVLSPQGWVELTPLEFKFLNYLVERKGSIVSKDRLLKDVWGFSFLPKTRTIDYLLTQLRKRIEPEPESPRYLMTIRGAGVKFDPAGQTPKN